MSHEQPTIEPSAHEEIPGGPEPESYRPLQAQEQWPEDAEELPRRPRRRLLAPVPLALLAVLAIACGFIAGVLVEKQQGAGGSAAASGSGLAARFAALRGGASSSGASGASGASSASGASGSGAAGAAAGGSSSPATGGGRLAGSAGGATAGQVAYVSGKTIYVTTAEGNTVKVTTSASSNVTKSVKSSVKGIHPGETVVVTGAAGTNGAISAESIRVGASGASGLGALFGGGRSGGTSAGASSTRAGGGEPALFGNGG